MTEVEVAQLTAFLRGVIRNSDGDRITLHKLLVLVVLQVYGTMQMATLQDWVLMSKSSMSRLVRELQNKGLITVVLDPEHGSRRLCTLTPEGVALISRLIISREQLEIEEQKLPTKD